jgi:hypothetical protein
MFHLVKDEKKKKKIVKTRRRQDAAAAVQSINVILKVVKVSVLECCTVIDDVYN